MRRKLDLRYRGGIYAEKVGFKIPERYLYEENCLFDSWGSIHIKKKSNMIQQFVSM